MTATTMAAMVAMHAVVVLVSMVAVTSMISLPSKTAVHPVSVRHHCRVLMTVSVWMHVCVPVALVHAVEPCVNHALRSIHSLRVT